MVVSASISVPLPGKISFPLKRHSKIFQRKEKQTKNKSRQLCVLPNLQLIHTEMLPFLFFFFGPPRYPHPPPFKPKESIFFLTWVITFAHMAISNLQFGNLNETSTLSLHTKNPAETSHSCSFHRDVYFWEEEAATLFFQNREHRKS